MIKKFLLILRFKIKKLEHELLFADPSKRKNLERGFLGPFAESQENINSGKKMPEILIQPYNLNTNKNFNVRFKDDMSVQDKKLPALRPNDFDQIVETDLREPNLRGLKDAVNQFTAYKKSVNFSNRSNASEQPPQMTLPQLNQNRYANNPIQDLSPRVNPSDPIVYSVASSYPQAGLQGTMSSANNLVPENIYSQVVAPANRQRSQPINDSYSLRSNQDLYESDQPVYMNTPYNMGNEYDQGDQYEDYMPANQRSGSDSSV